MNHRKILEQNKSVSLKLQSSKFSSNNYDTLVCSGGHYIHNNYSISGYKPAVNLNVKRCQGTRSNIYDCDYEMRNDLTCDSHKILAVACNKPGNASELNLIKTFLLS